MFIWDIYLTFNLFKIINWSSSNDNFPWDLLHMQKWKPCEQHPGTKSEMVYLLIRMYSVCGVE
jgi:hypothetical protein